MDIDTADKLSNLAFQLECGTNTILMMYECFRHDAFSSGMFAPATFAMYDYFNRLTEELKEIIGGPYDC